MTVGYRPLLWPGLAALAFTLGTATVALAALAAAGPRLAPAALLDPYLARALRFTVMQAGLSTLLALAFAVPVARALARRARFPGRRLFVDLLGLPLVLPAIVAVFGIAAVWGRNGAVGAMLRTLELGGPPPLYGLAGILLAHVFFNMPLAVRLLLPAWQAIPPENWRLASQLGMASGAIFRLIEWPRLAQLLPGIAGLVFLLCFTSFTVVLALGGGPGRATLEVAIYQALRLDFDLARAVALAVVQVAVCAAVAAVLAAFARMPASRPSEGRWAARPDALSPLGRAADAAVLAAGGVFVAAPLAAILLAGVTGPVVEVLQRPQVWLALLRSLAVGAGAGLVALAAGAALVATSRDIAVRQGRPGRADRLELAASLTLVVSPVVLGAGLFVLLLPLGVFVWALPLAALVNGMVAMPYAIRLLGPAMRRCAEHHDRLCAGLGMAGWARLRHVEWQEARRPAATALALAAALATGDLTAIALIGSEREATLSLLLYRALGSYRMDEAAVLALLLAATCLAVFVAVEGLVGGRARA